MPVSATTSDRCASSSATVWLLAGSVGLMMTGFGIILPVFARRMDQLGGGVAELGVMTMVFALAHAVLSPLMGSLSDRVGRRPLVLLGLAGFAASNLLYLLAPSTGWFIAARALAGVLTAGLYPAAMGAVDDVSPPDQRAARVGQVMAGYGIGFVVGPVLGGVLYDVWGFSAPFVFSAALGLLALTAAALRLPESRWVRRSVEPTSPEPSPRSITAWLPRPWALAMLLLATETALILAFSAVEPQMVFYVYDALGWSTTQFGVLVTAYGIALAATQALLSKCSDSMGRRRVIVAGLVLTSVLYLGMATITGFTPMLVIAAVAGMGTGLVGPALSAQLLEMAKPQQRGRVMGLRSAASSTGGVVGPLAIALVGASASATQVFLCAAGLVLGLAVVHLKANY